MNKKVGKKVDKLDRDFAFIRSRKVDKVSSIRKKKAQREVLQKGIRGIREDKEDKGDKGG